MSETVPRVDTSAENDRKGISKFIRRASRVLRPRSIASAPSELEGSQGGATAPRAPAPKAMALSSHPATTKSAPAPRAPVTVAEGDIDVSSTSVQPEIFSSMNIHKSRDPTPVRIPRRDIKDSKTLGRNQQEKAQMLFAKYGLTLEPRDWTPPSRSSTSQAGWVEKKVRIRVHRQCHNCGAGFGASKECTVCSHARCKKCPRFPPKPGHAVATPPTEGLAKIEDELASAVPMESAEATDMPAVRESEPKPTTNSLFNIAPPIHLQIDPMEQTAQHIRKSVSGLHQLRGRDVVYSPVAQRVRRFCHKCETVYKGRANLCESCGHQRCPNCPREPAKSLKFVNGYPGDMSEPEPTYPAMERVWRKPRHRVRWTCELCHTAYANSGEKQCKSCKHARCGSCIRDPPVRRVREQPEELLRTLESKFVGLQLLNPEKAHQVAEVALSEMQRAGIVA